MSDDQKVYEYKFVSKRRLNDQDVSVAGPLQMVKAGSARSELEVTRSFHGNIQCSGTYVTSRFVGDVFCNFSSRTGVSRITLLTGLIRYLPEAINGYAVSTSI